MSLGPVTHRGDLGRSLDRRPRPPNSDFRLLKSLHRQKLRIFAEANAPCLGTFAPIKNMRFSGPGRGRNQAGAANEIIN
jgi:hypothetical protein